MLVQRGLPHADRRRGFDRSDLRGFRQARLTIGANSYNAIYKQMTSKLQAGTISGVTPSTATKMFIGRATDTGLFTGTIGGVTIGNGIANITGGATR